jgi:excisionase family DNA binding protein
VSAEDPSDVLDLKEASRFFKCSPATLKRRAEVLHIPHKRLGSLWRFYRPAIERWMEEEDNRAA